MRWMVCLAVAVTVLYVTYTQAEISASNPEERESDLTQEVKKPSMAPEQYHYIMDLEQDMSTLDVEKHMSDMTLGEDMFDKASKRDDPDKVLKKDESDFDHKRDGSDDDSKQNDSDMASKEDDSDMASKEDDSNMASKEHDSDIISKVNSLDMASKEDDSDTTSKEHESGMASKEGNSDMVSKDGNSDMASKEDDSDVASKVDDSYSASKEERSALTFKEDISSMNPKESDSDNDGRRTMASNTDGLVEAELQKHSQPERAVADLSGESNNTRDTRSDNQKRDSPGLELEENKRCYELDEPSSYVGYASHTVDGTMCQFWHEQYPHRHGRYVADSYGYRMEHFRDKEFPNNWCRVPLNSMRPKPWCYTMDVRKRWAYCKVPFCARKKPTTTPAAGKNEPANCHAPLDEGDGSEFFIPSYYWNKFTQSCKQFLWSGEGGNSNRFYDWMSCMQTCYMECPARCEEKFSEGNNMVPLKLSVYYWDKKEQQCKNGFWTGGKYSRNTFGSKDECEEFCQKCRKHETVKPTTSPREVNETEEEDFSDKIREPYYTSCYPACDAHLYRGYVAETESGRECQMWSEQEPHKHGYGNSPYDFVDQAMPDNFCRDIKTGGFGFPWCFTNDPNRRWEKCNVKRCTFTECFPSCDARLYRGNMQKTQSGHTCQAWASQDPHKHDVGTAEKEFIDFKKSSSATKKWEKFNFCRVNMGFESPGITEMSTPWCFTEDKFVEYEKCLVTECNVHQVYVKAANIHGHRAARAAGMTSALWCVWILALLSVCLAI